MTSIPPSRSSPPPLWPSEAEVSPAAKGKGADSEPHVDKAADPAATTDSATQGPDGGGGLFDDDPPVDIAYEKRTEQLEGEQAQEEYLETAEEADASEKRLKGISAASEQGEQERDAHLLKKKKAKGKAADAVSRQLAQEQLTDGFGATRMDALRASATKLEAAAKMASGNPVLPQPRKDGDSPLAALNNAQPPGVYFRIQERSGRGGEEPAEPVDPELLQAVEEATTLLAPVGGIRGVLPGENEAREPVVLILVGDRSFTQGSLGQVPEKVRRFDTLVTVPYELLPLRRER